MLTDLQLHYVHVLDPMGIVSLPLDGIFMLQTSRLSVITAVLLFLCIYLNTIPEGNIAQTNLSSETFLHAWSESCIVVIKILS